MFAAVVLLIAFNNGWAIDVKAETKYPYESRIAELEKYRTTVASIPSVKLIDHNGRIHDIAKLFRDNILIVDFIFTSCRSICPIMTAVMKKVYSRIGIPNVQSVLFLSITVNPEEDTPKQLAESTKKTGNHANWLWLTGTPNDIAQVLQAFAININGKPETHPPVLYIGKEDFWLKWVGLPNADEVADAVNVLSKTHIK
ncbi:MAG: SCO family protein [Methylococcales bacterium]